MSKKIHNTAILEGDIEIADDVQIGPYCYLKGKISIESGTVLKSHVNIQNEVCIGKNNTIYPFSSIGTEPQDEKFKQERSYVKIGNNNIIRENVTINGGSDVGNHFKNIKNGTIIEDNCVLMISSHVAHNCYLENNVTLTNAAGIAGHCLIEHHAILGGMCGLHQFVRVGAYSMIGGTCAIRESVPPYTIVFKDSDKVGGLNIVGLKRNNFSIEDIRKIKEIYNIIYKNTQNSNFILDFLNSKRYDLNDLFLNRMIDFFQNPGTRGFTKPSQKFIDSLIDS